MVPRVYLGTGLVYFHEGRTKLGVPTCSSATDVSLDRSHWSGDEVAIVNELGAESIVERTMESLTNWSARLLY